MHSPPSPHARPARPRARRLPWLAAALLCGCGRDEPDAPPPDREPAARPNLLLISLDTTRADALEPYGAPPGRTPALARLAREGAVFETAISPAPLTLPAHATMLTGLDPPRHSVRDNGTYALPEEADTLAEALQAAGYRTFAAVGSMILLPRHGLDQGFGRYDASGLKVAEGGAAERQADAVVDAVLPMLSGPGPWFGFVHFYDPHQPYRAGRELVARFGDPYAAEIHSVDAEIGRILDALELAGDLDRTVVVVTADHGEAQGEHGESTHGMLLHGATQRVPLLVRGPGIERGTIEGVIATLADLKPTLLELAGAPVPAGLDGRSLAPALRGEGMEPGVAYLETLSPQIAYDLAPLFGVRTERWKLVQGARPHLWDLQEDPRELEDLAEERRDVVEALGRRLAAMTADDGRSLEVEALTISKEEARVLGGLGYVVGEETAAKAGHLPDPYDHIDAVEELGHVADLSQAGMADQAIERLEDLAERLPGSAHVRHALGALYGQRGDHRRALEEISAAARIRPRSVDLQIKAAKAAWFVRAFEVARGFLERARKLPGFPPSGMILLASVLVRQGERDRALELLQQVLRLERLDARDRSEAERLRRELRSG